MNKNQIFEIVKNNLPKIKEDFKVKNIWLFGSYSKNKQRENSDIDFLVEYEKDEIINSRSNIYLSIYLEELLNKEVEVGTIDSLIPKVKDYVKNDMEMIF